MIEYIPGHSYIEIAQEFSRRFRIVTIDQAKAFCKNNGIRTGKIECFKKGHVPWNKGKHTEPHGRSIEKQYKPGNIPPNWKPVGSERINRDGYIEIKVAERNKWKLKHRYIWEKAHGPIPADCIVTFKDGNKRNLDIENLAMITKAENCKMNHFAIEIRGTAFETSMLIANISLERSKRKSKSRQKA